MSSAFCLKNAEDRFGPLVTHFKKHQCSETVIFFSICSHFS